jgi:predicted peptidase
MNIEEVSNRHYMANNCLVYLPRRYFARSPCPLLLYLHGSGSRGNDIEMVRRLGLPRFLDEGGSYPTIVAAPQCQMNTSWHPEEVHMFLDFLVGRFAVDPNRVYILGESMGAYGAWNCATYMPERLAAVIPFCGGGDVDLAERLVQLPIWAFHGEEDTVVPPTESKAMVDAVNKAGGIARLTILSGRGHDISDVAWTNRKLLQWMLDQRRDANAKP